MATQPFGYGDKDYLERLNDLASGMMPGLTPISSSTAFDVDSNGSVIPVSAVATLTFDATCNVNGFGVIIWASGAGAVTIDPPINFTDGQATKQVAAGGAALLLHVGSGFVLFRFASVN